MGERQQAVQLALKRLQQYIATALVEPDAETAMLGACNGSLMRMLLRLDEAIAAVLAERPSGSEHLVVLARGIEMPLRLTTQVHRFSATGSASTRQSSRRRHPTRRSSSPA